VKPDMAVDNGPIAKPAGRKVPIHCPPSGPPINPPCAQAMIVLYALPGCSGSQTRLIPEPFPKTSSLPFGRRS